MDNTSPLSNESPSVLNEWPSTSVQKKKRAQSYQRPSVSQRIPVKKENAGSFGKTSKTRAANRRDRVLHRLGLSADQVDGTPQITYQLSQCGLDPKRVMEVLRGDQDENSNKAVALWDTLNSYERTAVRLEGVALCIGITPRRLWELYAGATMMQSRESVGVMIAESLPSILKVTIKRAKLSKGGYSDREHIFKAARVLPVPKGSTTNINVGSQTSGLDDGDFDDGGSDLESSDDALMKFSEAMGTKQLPAPTIDAEDEYEEKEG